MLYLLVVIGFLIPSRVLLNSFVGDDFGYINHPYIANQQLLNLFIGSSADLGGNSPITGHFYRPLMLLFFSLIDFMFGANSFFYHLLSLTIHLLNGVLFFKLLKKFVPQVYSFFISLIFLLHPINVETYAYASNLQDLLFVCFGLFAVLVVSSSKLNNSKLHLLNLLLFLSLLSKETGIIFVLICAFYQYVFQKERNIYRFLWYLGILLLYLLLRVGVAQVTISNTVLSPIGNLTTIERLVILPEIISYYISNLFFPINLSLGQVWTSSNSDVFGIYLPLIIAGAIITIGLRLKAKSTRLNFIFFLAWFVLGLLPHLQIIPLEMTVATRWFYFPIIGLLGMFGVVLSSYKNANKYKCVWLIILIVIVGSLSIKTFIRLGDWKNALNLYSVDSKTTKSYLLEHSLGYELMELKRMPEAFDHLLLSVDYYQTPFNTNSLGVYYYKVGNNNNAERWFEKSISNGDYFLAYQNLANLLLEKEDYKKASVVLKKAIKIFPKNAKFYHQLSVAEYKNGNRERAFEAAAEAFNLSPTDENEYVFHRLLEGKDLNIGQN